MRAMRTRRIEKIAIACLLSVLFWGVGAGWARAATQTLPPERIIREAREFIMSRLPWDEESADVSILYSGEGMELPLGPLDLQFQAPAKDVQAGRVPLALYVKVSEVVEKRIRLTALVTLTYEVVKTLRPVGRGEVIEADDVTLERVSATRSDTRSATRLEDVLGYETRRALKAGREIPLTSLKKPPLISKGDRVTLLVKRGSLRITASGRAGEDGYRDSLLPVTNLQTKKTVYGRVVDENTVEVVF